MKQQYRILHIITNTNAGGASLACFRLHKALLKCGVDSNILMLDEPPTHLPNTNHFYNHHQKKYSNRSWHKKVFDKFTCSIGVSHESFVRKERKIQKHILATKPKRLEVYTFPISNYNITTHPSYEDADIIHLHFVAGGFIDYQTFFNKCSKPIVWTLHDMNPFTGGCHFSGECMGFQSDCASCPELQGTEYVHYSSKMLQYKATGVKNKTLHIISPSRWLKNMSQSSKILGHCPHHLIPYAIDDEVFYYKDKKVAKERLGLDNSKKYLLFGAFNIHNRRKGFSLLYEALRKVSTSTKDIELLVIGKNDSEITVGQFKVHSFGFISDSKVIARYYQAADVFIMPSIADNLPNVILESLMCGTPVMAFNIGGIPDMITHNENGVLIDKPNANSLEKALIRCIENPISWNNRKIAEEAKATYNYTNIARQHKTLYNSLV